MRLSQATRRWLTRLDRKVRDADLRVRCRILLKLHAGQHPVLSCPWPAVRRQRRLAELRRLVLRPGPREVVLYADEVDLHLDPKIGRDWMLPGPQRRVMTPGKNQKHDLVGAHDPRRAEFVGVDRDRKATWLFLNLLRALWQEQHANVTRNHRHRTMRDLLAAVLHGLEARSTASEEYAFLSTSCAVSSSLGDLGLPDDHSAQVQAMAPFTIMARCRQPQDLLALW